MDVLANSFIWLLSIVLDVLGVPRAHVGALEVTHKVLLQVRPTPDFVRWEVLQPCTCRVGKVQGEVADDEGITMCAIGLTSKLVILEPHARIRFLDVLLDVCRWTIPHWDGRIEDVSAKDMGP
jgi:hypothetical protein